MRFPFIAAIAISVLATLGVYTSCNKDDGKPTTRIKCVTCANGGQCINDTCRCPTGWEGTACQTQTRSKYVGSWSVFERGSLSSTSHNYGIFIENPSFSAPMNSVNINYLYEYGSISLSYLYAYITADSIVIPWQVYDTKSIVGKGYFRASSTSSSGSVIRMRYMVKDTLTGVIDDFGYNSAADSPSVWTR